MKDVCSYFKQPRSLTHKTCSVRQVMSASQEGGPQFVDGIWHSALAYFFSVEIHGEENLIQEKTGVQGPYY